MARAVEIDFSKAWLDAFHLVSGRRLAVANVATAVAELAGLVDVCDLGRQPSKGEDGHSGLACERKRRRSMSSHSGVAKQLSHRALSQAPPVEPRDRRTPALRQRLPKAIEVYREPRSE